MVPVVANSSGTDSSPSLAVRVVFKRDTSDWTWTLRSASSLVGTAGDGASEERFTLGSPALIHQWVRRRKKGWGQWLIHFINILQLLQRTAWKQIVDNLPPSCSVSFWLCCCYAVFGLTVWCCTSFLDFHYSSCLAGWFAENKSFQISRQQHVPRLSGFLPRTAAIWGLPPGLWGVKNRATRGRGQHLARGHCR